MVIFCKNRSLSARGIVSNCVWCYPCWQKKLVAWFIFKSLTYVCLIDIKVEYGNDSVSYTICYKYFWERRTLAWRRNWLKRIKQPLEHWLHMHVADAILAATARRHRWQLRMFIRWANFATLLWYWKQFIEEKCFLEGKVGVFCYNSF